MLSGINKALCSDADPIQARMMSAASRIAACLKSVDFEVFGKVQGKDLDHEDAGILMFVVRGRGFESW